MAERVYTAPGGERVRLVALGGGRGPRGSKRSPRNCLLEREDGTRYVRPFRGLRRL